MEYKIIQTHLTFENETLKEVAVLWENNGDTKATISTKKRSSGYYSLKEYDIPTLTLFKKIAGTGMYLTDKQLNKYFPKQK